MSMTASDHVRWLLRPNNLGHRKYVRIPVHRVCGGYRPGRVHIPGYMDATLGDGIRGGGRWKKRREFSLDGK